MKNLELDNLEVLNENEYVNINAGTFILTLPVSAYVLIAD